MQTEIKEKLINKWLNDNFRYNHLEPFQYKELPHIYLLLKNGNVIFEYNLKLNTFWFSKTEITEFIVNFFDVDHEFLFKLIKKWISNEYNIKNVTFMSYLKCHEAILMRYENN